MSLNYPTFANLLFSTLTFLLQRYAYKSYLYVHQTVFSFFTMGIIKKIFFLSQRITEGRTFFQTRVVNFLNYIEFHHRNSCHKFRLNAFFKQLNLALHVYTNFFVRELSFQPGNILFDSTQILISISGQPELHQTISIITCV